MTDPAPIEVYKALADDTRHRLYRYLRLSGRPVSIQELSGRLSLHPNTLRPHLRRLQEVGLVRTEISRRETAGRPSTLYAAVDRDEVDRRGYRLLAEITSGLLTGARQRERAFLSAREWGAYLMSKDTPKPSARTKRKAEPDLAALRDAMAEAGFDPRFRRHGTGEVEITLRDCPFRELAEDHRDLVCEIHRGLLQGMLGAARPELELTRFDPVAVASDDGARGACSLTASARGQGGRKRDRSGR